MLEEKRIMLLANKKSSLFLFFLLISACFLFVNADYAHGTEVNSSVTIGFSVPSICGNGVTEGSEGCDDGNLISQDGCSNACVVESGGGPGGGGDTISPTITFISAAVTTNSAVIKWSATDDSSIASTYLNYGIGNYNTQIVGTSLGNNEYQASITSLNSDATYSFQITATDTAGNTGIYTSTFKTGSVPSDNLPIISNVSSSTSFTTAAVNWTATDDVGVNSIVFSYGLTPSYGLAEPITVAPSGNYSKNLTGLLIGTTYYFKITVTDTSSQTMNFTGSFTTLFQDFTPPNISDISVSAGINSCQISWQTDESTDGQVPFGLTSAYGSSASNPNYSLAHAVTLLGLLPNILYHFQIISVDLASNSTSTSDAVFTTEKDSIAPSNVGNLTLTAVNGNSFRLDWSNPLLAGENADFSGIKALRKVEGPSANSSDGVLVYTGSGASFTDATVAVNVRYYYTFFSYDTSDNYSSGASVDGLIISLENCTDQLDNDGDSLVDCLDIADCGANPACIVIGAEVCNDGLDNDGDGLVDCLDAVNCALHPSCQPIGTTMQCNDGLDNDSDDLVDLADSGCSGYDDNDEYNSSDVTVGGVLRISLSDLVFLAGGGKINLSLQGDKIASLTGSNLAVGVPKSALIAVPQNLILRVSAVEYQFIYNALDQRYYTSLSFSGVGTEEAHLEIDYGREIGFDALVFKLESLPFGNIWGENNERAGGAKVSLYNADGQLVSMADFGQLNPWESNANGFYGWTALNGRYYILAQKEDYNDRQTPAFTVSNNVINEDIYLIKKSKKLIEIIDPDATLEENLKNIAENLLEKATEQKDIAVQKVVDTAKMAREAADNPKVEKAAKRVVAPTAVSVVAVSTIPFISFADVFPFLRLLFLQPLFLLGYRRREKWGQVYNSLNKLPVDLAIVRLINADTGQMVQSKVTDKQGRYAFVAEPGKYRLEAQKSNFVFPSLFLANYNIDGRRLDIYHGEIIEVTEKDSVITANIPLDVAGEEKKKPVRLLWGRIARSLQSAIAILGFIITLISFYISPTWYIGALLFVHVGMSLLFKRLSKPIKTKGWGIVHDSETKKPVAKAVARLFSAQLDKLVASQITDRHGRYYFLAGDNKYYVTFDHKDYQPKQTEVIDLTGKEADTITHDVMLEKKKTNQDELSTDEKQ